MRRFLRAARLVVVLSLIASCGVPTNSGPVDEIAGVKLTEIDLLGPEFDSPATAPTALAVSFPDEEIIRVYFIGEENRLVAVPRAVSIPRIVDSETTDVEPETIEVVLQQLLAGPTEAERDELGYSTAIDAGLQILGVDFIAATVVVDVAGGSTLDSLTGDEAKLAFAQMVYTLTGLGPLASFLLRVDGELVGLPTDAGVNDPEEAVLRINYDGCCAPPQAAEPTAQPDPSAPVRSTPTPAPEVATPTPDTRPTPTLGAATPEPTVDS